MANLTQQELAMLPSWLLNWNPTSANPGYYGAYGEGGQTAWDQGQLDMQSRLRQQLYDYYLSPTDQEAQGIMSMLPQSGLVNNQSYGIGDLIMKSLDPNAQNPYTQQMAASKTYGGTMVDNAMGMPNLSTSNFSDPELAQMLLSWNPVNPDAYNVRGLALKAMETGQFNDPALQAAVSSWDASPANLALKNKLAGYGTQTQPSAEDWTGLPTNFFTDLRKSGVPSIPHQNANMPRNQYMQGNRNSQNYAGGKSGTGGFEDIYKMQPSYTGGKSVGTGYAGLGQTGQTKAAGKGGW